MPQTRVRKASTTVRVKDGQTIFLAGLLSEEKTLAVSKLPILGDIPLLGRLFRHTTESIVKKNLIIEITPKILHDTATVEMRTGDATGGGDQIQVPPAGQQNQNEPAPAAPAGTKQ
jgi:pilus assembly protein CpaC